MKFILLFMCLITSALGSIQKVPLMTGKLYIPEGYDNNDLVEIVIMGRLPDLCHRNPTHEVIREGNTFKIYLYAYYVPNKPCRRLSVPFMDKVNLGMLPQNTYAIELHGVKDKKQVSRLVIKDAINSLQDDVNYGNVMGIREEENSRRIELIGTNPFNCLKLDKLEADIQEKVIVLRPHFRMEGRCEEVPSPFSIFYEVPFLKDHPQGVLLHVRAMDGKSYNYFYQNKL
jgi:hypothetical protein